MDSKLVLMNIKNKGFFTVAQPFDLFVSDLCKRFARTHGEFLPTNDLDYIVEKLDQYGYLDEDEKEVPSFI